MSHIFAHRLKGIPAPATIEMARCTRALKAKGCDVISLALGEPDFPTPPIAIEAAYTAARAGQTRYPPVEGIPLLKEAIMRKFARENQLHYSFDEVMVSNGGKQVIFNAFMATLNAGDEVVIPAPYWVSYPLIAQMFGAVPVFVPCREEDGFHLRAEALAEVLTPRTRWVVLNFPNNPTGAVCHAEELKAIAEILSDYQDIWILSDEIYEYLVSDGKRSFSIASIAPDLKERTLTVNGVSKAYAMTGWRVGFAGGPLELISAMRRIQGNATSGVCSVAQAAAAAVLDGSRETVDHMVSVYNRRRKMVVEALRAIPALTCAMPEGAFYAYPGIAQCLGRTTPGGRVLKTDHDFAMALLEEAFVATVPGSAFGFSPHLRLSCATSEEALQEACRRIATFVDRLQ